MAGLLKHERHDVEPTNVLDRLDQLFDAWTRRLTGQVYEPWQMPALFVHEGERGELIRVDEYRDGDDVVIRAELPGIDPDEDVTIDVADHRLHIEAERHEDEEMERKGVLHRELRYGRFSRDLTLPEGVTDEDISASYADGILEIRVRAPVGPPPVRIPVARG
jgi:HSP20 family protein